MDYLKKKWQQSKKSYFILAVVLIVCSVFLAVYTIIHPRIYYVGMLLVLILFSVRVWKQMNPEKYVYPDEWEQMSSEERQLCKQEKKKRASSILTYLFAIPCAWFICMWFLLPCTLLCPQHSVWEYKGDMKQMKEDDPDVYKAFPESLPKGASHVKWIVCPGFLQAPSFEVLVFRIGNEYLEQIVDTYGKDAEIATYDAEYKIWSVDFIDSGLLSEPENTTVYVLYDNGDWNHHHIYGFWVNDTIGEIGFFAE